MRSIAEIWSNIFGELMMLIEPDKRSKEWEVPLPVIQLRNEFHFRSLLGDPALSDRGR
jgi:hypothetical protein